MKALLDLVTLDHIYYLIGFYLFVFAVLSFTDHKNPRQYGTAAFWGIYGVTFAFGKHLPSAVIGGCVVLLTVLAVAKHLGMGDYNESTKDEKVVGMRRFGGWIFAPALLVPTATFVMASILKVNALVSFGLCGVVALLISMLMVREGPLQAAHEGRRMCDAIGWAVILPQFLAALGALFDRAGVGTVISQLVEAVVPAGSRLVAVAAYCIGMALFTMIMGNAFAAFAVITAGIGIPLVIRTFGADPAIAGVIAMTSGYCGTLLTPMAANFNVVPAALLELEDKNGVIIGAVSMALLVVQGEGKQRQPSQQ